MIEYKGALKRRVIEGIVRIPFLWLVAVMTVCASCTTLPPHPPQPVQKQTKISNPYQINGQWYYPRAHALGFTQSGYASWYGREFHGRKTANGETYNMYGISAAHKTLPFNTIVRVRNLENGRELNIRINDRGPFVRGRIIDLSYGAAEKLGLVGPGTARVDLVALGTESGPPGSGRMYKTVDYDSGKFTFQVGAFRDFRNAENLRAKLDRVYQNAHIATYDTGSGLYYRVRVGFFTSLEEARRGEEILVQDGYEPFVVAE